MSGVEEVGELPSWSGEPVPTGSEPRQPALAAEAAPPTPQPSQPPERGRSGLVTGLVLGLAAGLLLAAVGIGAYWLGSRQNDDTSTGSATAVSAEDSVDATSTDGEADPAAPSTGGDADGDDATATTLEVDGADTSADDETATIGVADGQLLLPDGFVPSDPNYETRIQNAAEYAVVRGGKVYLYGFAPTQEALDQSIAITEGVMGPDGYVVERFVDPDAPEVTNGAPIYVDDKVLFAFNSTELEPESLPILDLGTALMLQNPTAQMVIIARTDAVGSEEANLEISQERGEAVVAYWASQGVDPSRMSVDARGEADASEEDSAEIAALNRSVEFVVSGIADGG